MHQETQDALADEEVSVLNIDREGLDSPLANLKHVTVDPLSST